MKKIIIILLTLTLGLELHAQVEIIDVNQKLDEAQTAYKSGDLESSRFALQEALQGINQAIGREILGLLPQELFGLPKIESGDNVTGTSIMFAGLFVNRRYEAETKNASVEIVSDSPLMAGINAFMALPAFMVSDPNQKRIKVGNYKGMLTKSEDTEGNISYSAQIPIGSTLFTLTTNGIDDEKLITDALTQMEIGKIAKIAE